MRLPSLVNILLLGSGARESAFAWKIAQSDELGKLYIAPGNAGTAKWGINVDVNPLDFSVVRQFVVQNYINLVVVGPEEPLVRGIRDYFKEDPDLRHVSIIGPSAAAAALEGSKGFAKEFMKRHKIPTARHITVTKDNLNESEIFMKLLKSPYVLKADGLAAGKGVAIIGDRRKARRELKAMLDGKFGKASEKVVIEEFLKGVELSVFVATDGRDYKILPSAKDYKRILEDDKGPNTGGMGAISPVPFADEKFMEKVRERIIEPTIKGIKEERMDYKGFIFIGLMNCNGDPKVIEYNVRMGDPETEVIVPRIESDIIDLFDGIVNESLSEKEIIITDQTAAAVVCVSSGYPETYEKGIPIYGLEAFEYEVDFESIVFHAGTIAKKEEILTDGGRVLAVTSLGNTIKEAVAKSYRTIDRIEYKGKQFRTDIGKDLSK